MNFLAHSYLSPKAPLVRLGNTFGDFVKGKEFDSIHPELKMGVQLHRKIDTFTDNHPITQKSKKIFINHLGHYSGIAVDMIYDYFLAKYWSDFSDISLIEYNNKIFEDIDNHADSLTENIKKVAPIMQEHGWILQYQSYEGMENILFQMSNRMKNKFDLTPAIPILKTNETVIKSMFYEFFDEAKSTFKN